MAADVCLNCGAGLSGAFCAACGQKHLDLRRPILALAGEAIGAAFNLESRAWRTLPLVLAVPGVVTRRYVDGQRARYVGPANLYALVTFVFFIVLSVSDVGLLVLMPATDGGIGIVVSGDEGSAQGSAPRIVSSGFTLGAFVPLERARSRPPGESAVASAALDSQTDATTQARVEKLLGVVDELTASPERTNELLEHWLPRLLILLVPLFALVLKLVFVKRGALLYEHLVFSLYLHTSLFMLMTLLVAAAAASAALALQIPLAASFIALATGLLGLALHHTYGGGFARTAARLVGCLAGYAVVFTVALNAVLLYGLR